MKNYFKPFMFLIVGSLIFASCSNSNDDPNTTQENLEELANALEATPLIAKTVADNVVIAGGTKEAGNPPTPNQAISMDLLNTSSTAFLNEGFEIKLSSDAVIKGAYIQFKSKDGIVADTYYDVDIVLNNSGKYKPDANKLLFNRNLKQDKISAKTPSAYLDIDFNSQITPGTFCYVICVYDAEGNISAPQEVCVTVESWGGNNNIIGAWALTKEEYIENGEIITDTVGVESCEEDTYDCSNNNTFSFTECNTTESATLVINKDGSFNVESKSSGKYLDYGPSMSSCQAFYIDYMDEYYGTGNWAYGSETKRLTFVEYAYTDISIENGVENTENYTNNPGEGDLVFDGTIVLNGNTLIIMEEYDYDDDGIMDEIYKLYFTKK